MAKKHKTAHQKALWQIEKEGQKQCFLLYGAAALALWRHWNKKREAILKVFDITGDVWRDCAGDNLHSMIEMCEKETGIEIQCGNGKSWRDLPYLNATLDTKRMSNAMWVYMRQQQVKWIAPQVMACIMVALHRKYGFGFERCARIYEQIKEIENEYQMDPKRIQAACMEETGINIYDVVTKRGEEKQGA